MDRHRDVTASHHHSRSGQADVHAHLTLGVLAPLQVKKGQKGLGTLGVLGPGTTYGGYPEAGHQAELLIYSLLLTVTLFLC